MKKALKKSILKSTLVISLSLSIFNQGIAQESKYSGQKPINSKSVPGSAQDAFSQIPEKFKWFEEAKFGLFIHWGLFSIPASMWNGVPASRTSEYIMMEKEIPVKTYKTLADHFNPFQFDAERWVQMAEDAGMKYIVFVSKHHDGFAMYQSKVSPYNVVDATPWKRDPLKELAEACRRHKMRLGVYYSQAVDWEHPDGAGNSWDFNEKDKDFDKYLREKALPQVRELLTNYGPISTFWFDWPEGMTKERCKLFSDMARSLQPDMLINSRLGDTIVWPGPTVDYRSMGDDEIPNAKVSGIWESAGTMNTSNGTWGYNQYDQDWKSLSAVIFNLVDIVSKGGVYLLNTGPTSDGVIPKPTQEVFLGVGKWLKINGESIYGAGPTPFGYEFGSEIQGKKDKRGNPAFDIKKELRFTTKPGKLYVHIFNWPNVTLEITGLKGKVNNAYFLADPDKKPLPFSQIGEKIKLTLPQQAHDTIDSVVCLELNDNQ
jgi:alpha-L-fucosidase